MRGLLSVSGLVAALLPVLYCGGLIVYFVDLTGSVDEAKREGLGPTLLGLGFVGLLLCIPLFVKIVRVLAWAGSGGRSGPDAATRAGKGGADADAVIARYMAQRSAEATPGAPATPAAREGGAQAGRAGFGRKTVRSG